jgi:5'-3' exonuclease
MEHANGIWIPAEVWELDLPPLHRIFLARLMALSKQDGASWAGDEFLALSLRCTPQHVRKMRLQLEASGHIITHGYGHNRRLSVEVAPVVASNQRSKQPEAQKLQPEAQELQPQLRQEATTVAQSIEENRYSKEVVKTTARAREVVWPFNSDQFMNAWKEWEADRRERRVKPYTTRGLQTALHRLQQISEYNEGIAIRIISQSIANGWQGLFPLDNKRGNHQHDRPRGKDITPDDLARLVAKRYGPRFPPAHK